LHKDTELYPNNLLMRLLNDVVQVYLSVRNDRLQDRGCDV